MQRSHRLQLHPQVGDDHSNEDNQSDSEQSTQSLRVAAQDRRQNESMQGHSPTPNTVNSTNSLFPIHQFTGILLLR